MIRCVLFPRFSLEIDEDGDVVALTVFEGEMKPCLYHGKAYRRADSSMVEVGDLEDNRLVLAGSSTTLDALESSWQNLSFSMLEHEIEKEIGHKRLDKNALVSLELISLSSTYDNDALLASKNYENGCCSLGDVREGVNPSVQSP